VGKDIGKNVNIDVTKDKLTIVVDLKKDFGPSNSQKTIIVASSEGNAPIPGTDIKFGLNVYKPNNAKPA
jgi:hypothetical protein